MLLFSYFGTNLNYLQMYFQPQSNNKQAQKLGLVSTRLKLSRSLSSILFARALLKKSWTIETVESHPKMSLLTTEYVRKMASIKLIAVAQLGLVQFIHLRYMALGTGCHPHSGPRRSWEVVSWCHIEEIDYFD